MLHEILKQLFHSRDRIRHLTRAIIGLLTGLVGLADMLSAIVPRLDWISAFGTWPIASDRVPAQTFTVVIGFFLIVLSYGLAHGKRHAWHITLALLLLSAILHIQRSGSVLATLTAVLLAVVLITLSRFFHAKSDPPSARRGYIALCLGLGIVSFYTIGGFFVLYNDFTPWIDHIGIEGIIMRILAHTPVHVSRNTPAFFFERALPLLCISSILYGMAQIFRPVAAVLMPDTAIRKHVSELVRLYGTNSISYYALTDEKTYFFSASGRSVISYVLEGGTAVVAGDPIGPLSEIPLVIKEFVAFCQEQDWSLAFWQIRDEMAELYRTAGFQLLKIGEDAVVDPQTFTLRGNKMATVREKARRAEKDGLHIVIYSERVTNPEYLKQMEYISSVWLAKKGGCEMGFSQGIFHPQGDREQLYALAIDEEQKVHAFMSFVPIYGRNGWGVDLMRRLEQTSPGTMYLLLAHMVEHFKDMGTVMLSLGLAPMQNVNAEEDTFVGSSIDFLTGRFGNMHKNQSLSEFKKRFQPVWESRYLAYGGTLSLPKVGWALYHAHQTDISLLAATRRSLGHWRRQRRDAQRSVARQLKSAKA